MLVIAVMLLFLLFSVVVECIYVRPSYYYYFVLYVWGFAWLTGLLACV